jgi:hypothetical protein
MSNTTLTSPESVASLSALIRQEAAENGYTEQEQAYCVYSDEYKEDWGVRPRFAAGYSFEQLVNAIIFLHVGREHTAAMEKDAQERKRKDDEATAEALRKATTPTPVAILGDYWPK